MVDPTSALLLFTLFQATEKVIGYTGGKVADAMGKPAWEALEGKARWLAKNDDTAKRWRAFATAFEQAKVTYETQARNPAVAHYVSDILENLTLDSMTDRDWLSALAPTPDKIALLGAQPDINAITDLIDTSLKRTVAQPPSRAELSEAVVDFVRVFRDRLFDQASYRQLFLLTKVALRYCVENA
jgi:hypothetical protein